MIIRRAVKKDLNKVYLIELASFPEPWSREFFAYFIEAANTVFLVAVEDDVVGYVIWMLESTSLIKPSDGLNIGHLLNLAVKREYRGRKIASSLLSELFKEIGEYKPVATYLEVACSNQAAVKLYLKFNFKIISTIPKYYRVEGDAYLMVHTLI